MGLEQWPIAGGSFTMFGEELYLVPKQMVDMKGLKVLRPGLDLGTIKKGRFDAIPWSGIVFKERMGRAVDRPAIRQRRNYQIFKRRNTEYRSASGRAPSDREKWLGVGLR